MARVARYRALLPSAALTDPAMLSRILHRLAGQLHELIDAQATPGNTVRTFACVGREGQEQSWAPGDPWPEWATGAVLDIRRRDTSPAQDRLGLRDGV